MRPRAIGKLASRKEADLFATLSEGLTLIAEHVASLERAIEGFTERRVIEATRVVSEEAGKYLVLVDVARCARTSQEMRLQQLKRANSHLAKGIYARVAEMRPAGFDEVLRYVDLLRRSHYLDGPNDVDWIFRNEIEARREERLYVDYVEADHGDAWQSPQNWDSTGPEPPSSAVALVGAFDRVGIGAREGLTVIADVWDSFVPISGTCWQDVEKLSLETLERVQVSAESSADRADLRCILETWSFPLWHVDLDRIAVDINALRAEQNTWCTDVV